MVVYQDHLLVKDAVAAHEQDADAGLLQFPGEVIGGFADAGAGSGAVFADDYYVEALSGFIRQYGVEIVYGRCGTTGNIIGADPDGCLCVLDGFKDGLAERAGGEKVDETGIPFGMAQRATNAEHAVGLGGIVVENVANGGLGNILHHSAGGAVLEHVTGGLYHENPTGHAGAVAEGDFVGGCSGRKEKKEHAKYGQNGFGTPLRRG